MKNVFVSVGVLAVCATACTADLKVTKDSTTANGVSVDASINAPPAPPALDAGETMQSVITGNVWVRVRGFGAGVPMVLVPGAPGTGSYLLKGFEAIGEDRNVMRYDLLGTGRSDPLPDTAVVTPNRAADDLESLRRAMKTERWSVVGHSYGAATAVAYANARPREVLGLVLISPLFANDDDSTHTMSALMKAAGSSTYAADLDSLRTMPGALVDASMKRTVSDSTNGGLTLGAAADVLRKWKVPTLIIVGDRDTTGLKSANALIKALPTAKVITIPNAGVFAVVEARDATRDAVRAFLTSIEPTPKFAAPVKRAGPRK
jgi:pimeloyl-ACP methyl ester carboxylesterase